MKWWLLWIDSCDCSTFLCSFFFLMLPSSTWELLKILNPNNQWDSQKCLEKMLKNKTQQWTPEQLMDGCQDDWSPFGPIVPVHAGMDSEEDQVSVCIGVCVDQTLSFLHWLSIVWLHLHLSLHLSDHFLHASQLRGRERQNTKVVYKNNTFCNTY